MPEPSAPSFGIRASDFFRHWCFVIRHSTCSLMPSPPVLVLVLRVFLDSRSNVVSLFPQALSGEFDEDVFERGALQLNVGKFDTLLVNPLHQLDKRLRRPRRLNCQHLAISANRGF